MRCPWSQSFSTPTLSASEHGNCTLQPALPNLQNASARLFRPLMQRMNSGRGGWSPRKLVCKSTAREPRGGIVQREEATLRAASFRHVGCNVLNGQRSTGKHISPRARKPLPGRLLPASFLAATMPLSTSRPHQLQHDSYVEFRRERPRCILDTANPLPGWCLAWV